MPDKGCRVRQAALEAVHVSYQGQEPRRSEGARRPVHRRLVRLYLSLRNASARSGPGERCPHCLMETLEAKLGT